MVIICVIMVVLEYISFAIVYITKMVEGGPYMPLH
jgi:hypothetical protein